MEEKTMADYCDALVEEIPLALEGDDLPYPCNWCSHSVTEQDLAGDDKVLRAGDMEGFDGPPSAAHEIVWAWHGDCHEHEFHRKHG